jgi:hypothetical protein
MAVMSAPAQALSPFEPGRSGYHRQRVRLSSDKDRGFLVWISTDQSFPNARAGWVIAELECPEGRGATGRAGAAYGRSTRGR